MFNTLIELLSHSLGYVVGYGGPGCGHGWSDVSCGCRLVGLVVTIWQVVEFMVEIIVWRVVSFMSCGLLGFRGLLVGRVVMLVVLAVVVNMVLFCFVFFLFFFLWWVLWPIMGLVVMSFVVFFPPMVVVVGNGLQVAGCLFVVEVLWCIFFS